MIRIKQKGNFDKTLSFLEYALKAGYYGIVVHYGKKGVEALEAATPKDTGETARSWYYKIAKENGKVLLSFHNSKTLDDGTPIVILIQYGHATKNGGFVLGNDFINPALRPIFESMANEIWGKIISVK